LVLKSGEKELFDEATEWWKLCDVRGERDGELESEVLNRRSERCKIEDDSEQ
jgi:hypothetical protein